MVSDKSKVNIAFVKQTGTFRRRCALFIEIKEDCKILEVGGVCDKGRVS
jgi:hypothetical protein